MNGKWVAVNAGAPMFTAKELAAAEERGRRAGIEEVITIASGFGTFGQGLVKQLRTLLRHDAEPPKRATVAELEAILALPDDALEVYVLPNGEVRARPRIRAVPDPAPRDSGPVCKCGGAADAKFYDGGHLPDCPVVAPRDSGKERVLVLHPGPDGTCAYCHVEHFGICDALHVPEDRK